MSLSFRSSPFSAEPNRESFRIRFLLQKSATFSRGRGQIALFTRKSSLLFKQHANRDQSVEENQFMGLMFSTFYGALSLQEGLYTIKDLL